jgi:hypothetical protein
MQLFEKYQSLSLFILLNKPKNFNSPAFYIYLKEKGFLFGRISIEKSGFTFSGLSANLIINRINLAAAWEFELKIKLGNRVLLT